MPLNSLLLWLLAFMFATIINKNVMFIIVGTLCHNYYQLCGHYLTGRYRKSYKVHGRFAGMVAMGGAR